MASLITSDTNINNKEDCSTFATRHNSPDFNEDKIKILVAEDNRPNQDVIKGFLLEICQCEIDFAKDGREAIKMASSKKYDLCLMDLQMPVMDGIEATKFIREHVSRSLHIVAVTAAVLPEDKEKSLKAGMNGFLTKPIDFDELKSVIDMHIKKEI